MSQVIYLIDSAMRRREAVQLVLTSVGGFDVRAFNSAALVAPAPDVKDWVLAHHSEADAIDGINAQFYTDVKAASSPNLLWLDMVHLPAFAEQVRLRFCSSMERK